LILDTNGQLQKIPVSEIYEVKVRKFSLLKSSGLLVSSLIVATGVLFAIFLSNLNDLS
jgi:hypothetical protein